MLAADNFIPHRLQIGPRDVHYARVRLIILDFEKKKERKTSRKRTVGIFVTTSAVLKTGTDSPSLASSLIM